MFVQHTFPLGQAIAALVVLVIVLAIHYQLATRALADLAQPGRRVRTWTRQTWTVVIILCGIIGPLAYFSFGRDAGT